MDSGARSLTDCPRRPPWPRMSASPLPPQFPHLENVTLGGVFGWKLCSRGPCVFTLRWAPRVTELSCCPHILPATSPGGSFEGQVLAPHPLQLRAPTWPAFSPLGAGVQATRLSDPAAPRAR